MIVIRPTFSFLSPPLLGLALSISLISAPLLTTARLLADEAPPAPPARAKASDSQVDFARDIAPVLTRHCIACHNTKKAEGGLNLESYASMMLGGDSGPAIVPQDVEESYLHSRVVDADDPMPPEDNTVGAKALTPEEVAVLTKWIIGGALDSEAGTHQSMAWQAIPESLSPIYALDSSRDGLVLAIGHGNTVQLARPVGSDSNSVPQDLIDGNLQLPDGTPLAATHYDLVQSVAFSPDSQLLATGGFRTVKLWQRQTAARPVLDGLATDSRLAAISPSQERLAIVSQETGIELVNVSNAQSQRLESLHAQPIRALHWLSAQTLLSADSQGGLVITQADTNHSTALKGDGPAPILKRIVSVGKRAFALGDSGGLFEIVLASKKPLTEAVPEAENLVQFRALPLTAAGNLLAAVELPEPSLLLSLSDKTLVRVALDDAAVLSQWPSESELQQIQVSPGGETLLTIASDGTAQLRKMASGELLVALDHDYTQAAKFRKSERDTTRQKAYVDQLVAQLPELQKASEAEIAAHKKVQETREEGAAALATQDTAVAAARTSHSETEKALAAARTNHSVAEKALAAAQKRVVELTKELETKQKATKDAETKDAETEQAAAQKRVAELTKELEAKQKTIKDAETKQAAAQKRVAELTKELEAKQKAIKDAETKQTAAAAELAKRDQDLATAAEGVKRAAERISSLEALTAAERKTLSEVQTRTQELQGSVVPPAAIAGDFNRDGTAVVIAGSDHALRLYATATGRPQANLSGATAPLISLHSAADQRLLGLTADGHVLSWDLNLTWQLQRTIGSADEELFSDRICALDFSPDGRALAVGSGPPSRFGDIKLVDVAGGQITRDLGEVHGDTVLSVRFSPDGSMLASGGADKLCRLWDVESGAALRSFEGHTHHVMSIAWHDSGERLATSSADHTIKVWKVQSGEQLRTIAGFNHEVTAIAFVGNTAQLAAVAADGQARLLNTDDGKTLRGLAGADNALYALTISADNLRVTAGGQVGKIWTWLIADGKLVE